MKQKKLIIFTIFIMMCAILSACDGKATYTHEMTLNGEIIRTLVIFTGNANEKSINYSKESNSYRYEYALNIAKAYVEDNTHLQLTEDKENYTITIREYHASIADYYAFYGIDNDTVEEDTSVTTKEGFYKYVMNEQSHPFKQDSVLQIIDKISDELGIPKSEMNLEYVYGTPYENVSTNANKTEERGGMYYHTWKSSGYTKDMQNIELTTKDLNYELLYGIFIGLALLALIIVPILNKYRPKKETKVNEQT